MSQQELTEELLRKLYVDEGLTMREIAKLLKCSTATLSKKFREYNISARPSNKPVPFPFSVEEFTALYIDENLTVREISQKFSISEGRIAKFIKRNNIKKSRELVAAARERTNLERYGVENAFQSEEIKDKIKATNRERYGVEHVFQSDAIKEKARRTCFDKYGVESPSQSQEIRDKIKATNLERYGSEVPTKSQEIKNKIKKTNLERYGTEVSSKADSVKKKQEETNMRRYGTKSSAQNPDVKAKQAATNMERYGHISSLGNPEIQRKAHQTMLEQYGVEHPMQNEEIREKTAKTLEERYGARTTFDSAEIQEKARQSILDRYGVENVFASAEIQERIRAANLERYGCENPIQNPDIIEKRNATNLERYGFENAIMSPEIAAKRAETNLSRYGSVSPFGNAEINRKAQAVRKANSLRQYGTPYASQKEISHFDEWVSPEKFHDALAVLSKETSDGTVLISDVAEYFSVAYTSAVAKIHEYNQEEMISWRTSSLEEEWRRFLYSHDIPFEPRPARILDVGGTAKQDIDIFLPEFNIGLEINPSITHNSSLSFLDSPAKTTRYHQLKSLAAESQGINLIHIFDFYDTAKMEALVLSLCHRNSRRVFARNTDVVLIEDAKAERDFLGDNHLQGYVRSQICYGLYTREDHDLVAVMSFGVPRYGNKENAEWELLRFCSLSNTTVVGGASKLFAAFVRDHDPSSVMSFANYDISNGDMYEKLGFDFIRYTSPSYTWVSLDDPSITYSWYLIATRGFDNVFETSYGKGVSNIKLMEEHGFVRVYNSGNKVYVWNP